MTRVIFVDDEPQVVTGAKDIVDLNLVARSTGDESRRTRNSRDHLIANW
jgi:hypothetical protein